jgi:uncharacterized protein (DUF1330 family)
MGVYIIVQLDIHNREDYDKYALGFMDIFPTYDCKILAVDEEPKIIEGDWPYTRTVLGWCSSSEEFMRMYNSQEYQEIAKLRFSGAKTNFVMLQELDRVQDN